MIVDSRFCNQGTRTYVTLPSLTGFNTVSDTMSRHSRPDAPETPHLMERRATFRADVGAVDVAPA